MVRELCRRTTPLSERWVAKIIGLMAFKKMSTKRNIRSISKTNPEIFVEIFRINSFSSPAHTRSTEQLHYKLASSLVYSLRRAKHYNDRNIDSSKRNVCTHVKRVSLRIIYYYVSHYHTSDLLLIRCVVFDIIRVGKKSTTLTLNK